MEIKKQYLELLREEIFLCGFEERLNKAGEYAEARQVREERKQLEAKRMVLKGGMAS